MNTINPKALVDCRCSLHHGRLLDRTTLLVGRCRTAHSMLVTLDALDL